MEKLIQKRDNLKIEILPYNKFGYKFFNNIVLILNFIAYVAHLRNKSKLSLLSVYQAIQIKKLLYFGQFDALMSFLLNLNFLSLLHSREMYNHSFTLSKHLIRVGEEWHSQIETEGEITSEDVNELKQNLVILDSQIWCKPSLEKYVMIEPNMKILEMNKSLRVWVYVKLIGLYKFLADLLHSKVRENNHI